MVFMSALLVARASASISIAKQASQLSEHVPQPLAGPLFGNLMR